MVGCSRSYFQSGAQIWIAKDCKRLEHSLVLKGLEARFLGKQTRGINEEGEEQSWGR
jgi:hypothetical protein